MDAARENDLRQSVIEGWINTFLEFGRHGLKNNPKRVHAEYEAQIKAHREKIGELVLQRDVLKKPEKCSVRTRTRLASEDDAGG